ncbi:MAG: VOC family protein [Magnetococcus sp. WYHC-3]
MAFAYTILYVDDVGSTLDFYAAAFGLPVRLRHESGDYGEMDTGGTTLSFTSRRLMRTLGKHPSSPDPSQPQFEIAFTVEDVPAALDRALTAGAQLVQPPAYMPWGQTTAYVTDLNGFLVELCTVVTQQPAG